MHWYLQVLKKYADFSGRARRKEYWIFFFVNSLVVSIIFAVGFSLPQAFGVSDAVLMAFAGLSFACSIALSLPGLALAIRRLHDTNHSGWSLLIALVPLIGGIVLLVWFCRGGDAGPNQYGPDPKQDPESEPAIASSEGLQTGTQRKARWLLPLEVIAVVAVTTGGYLYVVNRGTAEAGVLAACTGIAASAQQVANSDLTPLGLQPVSMPDARSIYGDGFADAAVVEYGANGQPAARVGVLQYSTSADASGYFDGLAGWAQVNCGRSSWTNVGSKGVIHCYVSDGHHMILRSDNWILDIGAADIGEVSGAELAGQIRDAIVTHWQGLSSGL